MNDLIAEIQSCDCGTSGSCTTTCASEFCLNGSVTSAGDACDTCINDSLEPDAGCYTQIDDDCSADANCVAYLDCADGCPQ